MTEDLVSTDWLQSHLQDSGLRIIDCRWILGNPGEGRRQYEQEHISGAVHLDVDTQLSGKEGPGRHPIPDKRDFQKILSGVGVDRETTVIVYDEGKGMPAARLWWLLRYFGHEKVSLLDGGWNLWKKEMRPTGQEIPSFAEASFRGRAKLGWVLDKEGVDSLRDDPEVLLMDARAPERYRGEVEPIDARAGHIPGAENFPYIKTIDPDTGRFFPPETLRAEFRKIGADKAETIICYCGSGVTACTNILALKFAGFDAKLYEGSWSDWAKDPDKPIAK